MTQTQILNIIKNNINKIKSFGIIHIGLFGSAVRNEIKEESDLDFIIEFDMGKKTFDNYMDAKFYLQDIFNRNIDLVIKENIKEDLKEHILKDVVYAA
ncbi:MAG: nucleotidyltransferase domain-containing protein [Spirochaetia bacterium]|nr:nucleotidyltransferase domain-containing protein [Spirochaetia bacterium]